MCDLRLEDIDDIILLEKIKEKYPDLRVIIITGHSDIKTSTLALKQGVFGCVVKPLITEQILFTIQEALSNKKEIPANSGNEFGNNKPEGEYFFWGDTDSCKKLYEQVQLVGPAGHNVIIYGEDGTGKKSIAHEIHKRSKRSHMPLVIFKASTLFTDKSLEKVLGRESINAKGEREICKGILEQANGGTLFISEAEFLPLEIQEVLLQVMQRKKLLRIEGIQEINLDIRVFIASNHLLWNATRSGKFREDLYLRLNDFNILIPSLRHRQEDIPVFADHFLRLFCETFHKPAKGFTPDAITVLKNYIWNDNIRELKNVVKRAVLSNREPYVGIESLPDEVVNPDKMPVKPGDPH
jgi:two-component system response regulator HydG